MAANIKVIVRVRPMNDRELRQRNNRTVIEIVDENQLVFGPKEKGLQQPSKSYLKRNDDTLKFAFGRVCGPNATNQDVFESATKDVVAALMEGYNCSVCMYGAKGAGKTFTLMGTAEQPGLAHLMVDHLFQTINGSQLNREFDIATSCIEVYNDNVFDLLKPSSTPLQLRGSNECGVTVAGVSIFKIQTAQQLQSVLELGHYNMALRRRGANAESSCSHAVSQVYITIRCKVSGQRLTAKLSLVDLAGERPSANAGPGARKKGADRSLLALRSCVSTLADGSTFVPYRDSKLTYLLKDCFGSNPKSKMLVIANVSPSSMCYEDTYNTLKFAARANKVQLSLKKNVVGGDPTTSQCETAREEQRRDEEMQNEFEKLQAELELLKLQ